MQANKRSFNTSQIESELELKNKITIESVLFEIYKYLLDIFQFRVVLKLHQCKDQWGAETRFDAVFVVILLLLIIKPLFTLFPPTEA